MNDQDIPKVLPIVPIKNKVLIPGAAIVLQIVSKGSVQLLQRIYRSSKNIIGCVPFQSPSYVKFEPKDTNISPTVPFTSTRNGNRNSTPKRTVEELFNQETQPSDLYEFGCAARIDKLERTVSGFAMTIKGVVRIHVDKYVLERPYLEAEVTVFPDPSVSKDDQELQELTNSLRSIGRELHVTFQNLKFSASDLAKFQKDVENSSAGVLTDLLINAIECTYEERLQILDALDLKTRMTTAIGLLTKRINLLKMTQKVHSAMNRKHKEFYLRQHLNAIKEELGERDESNEDDDITDLTKRIKEGGLSPEADKAAQRELKRLKRMHPTQAEYQVVRTYLECLSEIPWRKSTTDILDTDKARQQLDDDHYGLESVKKRVLEFLAVLRLKGDSKGPILCLLGPPGVGKTSLGKSIASSLGRKFHRISLGGVRDEAEIRGHRRTYIGAMPGLIAQGLRRVGVNNPVFLLDEIDKVGHLSNHGDPSAALLEVLDPEQNNTFNDHYLNVPLDLSKVLFIATANHVDTIPAPLLDRMELINVPGYTFDEKINIAQRHLLPKQISNHGLSLGDVKLSDDVLLKIASGYTREAGVRNFEREIASVCRAKAVEYANAKDKDELDNYMNEITVEEIETILGVTKFDSEVAERTARPGVVTGLAWTASGSGGILFIEATQMAGKGNLQLTGKLGEVIRESAIIALSWVRAHALKLEITTPKTESTFFFQRDVHIHFPAGAVGKDGPSAGAALTVALVSLLTHRHVPPTTAMTGEITLRGQVLPVGSIKEKIIGAHRAGIKKVILPTRNRKDVEGDVPVNVKNEINFVYANNIYDVLQGAFEGEKIWSDSAPIVEFESRL